MNKYKERKKRGREKKRRKERKRKKRQTISNNFHILGKALCHAIKILTTLHYMSLADNFIQSAAAIQRFFF